MDMLKQSKWLNDYAILSFEYAVKIILSIVIIVIIVTMGLMAFKSILMLKGVLKETSIQNISKIVIVNVLMILALLEVFRTALLYFTEGRIKVTYIIDTALVVVISEVTTFWFKDIEYEKLIMVIAIVFTLIIARILTIRFSPTKVTVQPI